jgi:hypothetical protein
MIVSFYWNNVFEPSFATFQIRVEFNSCTIHWCVVDEGVSISIISSYDWIGFSSLDLVLASNQLLDFDTIINDPLGVLPQFVIMLDNKTFLVSGVVRKGPLDFNILLGHDYMYDMNDVMSLFLYAMHFPHNGIIVTIN